MKTGSLVPLATTMLVAGINANSDNSLSRLLGMGNMDMFLNLESKHEVAEHHEPAPEHDYHVYSPEDSNL